MAFSGGRDIKIGHSILSTVFKKITLFQVVPHQEINFRIVLLLCKEHLKSTAQFFKSKIQHVKVLICIREIYTVKHFREVAHAEAASFSKKSFS